MTSQETVIFDVEAIHGLTGEAFKLYMWMKVYLPKYGYEISYRDLAKILQSSPTTMRKHMDTLVAEGYIERIVDVGMTATYRVLK